MPQLEPGVEPADLEALEWLALELVAGECPNHAPLRRHVGAR